MQFKSYALRKVGLEFLEDFNGLQSVYIDASHYHDSMDLFDLPSTITSLHIEGSCEHWLREKSGRGIFQEARTAHVQVDGGGIFPFKGYLISLRHLELTCHYLTGTHRCVPGTDKLVSHYLPPSLNVLRLSHLDHVSPNSLLALPNLTSLSQPRHPPLVPLFHHLPLALPHSKHYFVEEYHAVVTPPDYPTMPKNARTVALQLKNTQGWLNPKILQKLASVFPMDRALPSTDLEASLSPVLTTLVSAGATFDEERDESLVWPLSLKEVHLFNEATACNSFGFLPRYLQHLTVSGILTMDSVKTLPPSLTSLAFNMRSSLIPATLDELPSTLTELEVAGSCIGHHTSHLPRGLKTLRLLQFRCNSYAQFWNGLPPGLTDLHCKGTGNDHHLNLMPKSLTKVWFSDLWIFGNHYMNSPQYSSATTLDIPSELYISHHLDGTVMLSGTPAVWNELTLIEPMRVHSHIERLPITLTVLSISAHSENKLQALNLPNVTRLTVAAFHSFNWTSTLPSLTHLVLTRIATYCPPDLVNLKVAPPALTHLTIKGSAAWSVEIPACLHPKLLNFEDATGKIKFDWKLLPNLTSLTQAVFTVYQNDVKPTEKDFFSDLPALRHLAIDNPYWLVKESTLKEIEATQSLSTYFCRSVSIQSLEPYGPAPLDCMVEGSIDVGKAAARMLMNKYSFLKLADEPIIHINELTKLSTSLLLDVVGPRTLTSLTVGKNVRLWPKFAKMLPSTLLKLDILHVSGVHCGTPRALPASLKELRINALELTRDAYRDFPKGLTMLVMRNGTLVAKHTAGLPQGLLKLSIDASCLGDNALENLPRSITALELKHLLDLNFLYRGLPPQLRELTCQSYSFYYNPPPIDMTRLPPTITKVNRDPHVTEDTTL